MTKALGLPMAIIVAVAAASPASARGDGPKAARDREFTLGLVQKEVRSGMSQADLVSALGSPNILTRDSQGRESWVYDRIATEVRVRSTGFGGSGGGIGTPGSSLILGVLSGQRRDEKLESSQRTLTVVIRFDPDGRVESFAFHASRF